MAVGHNRSRYLQGCRCGKCVKANSDYKKGLRQRSNGQVVNLPKAPPPNPAVGDSEPAAAGVVESGVLAEIEKLSTTETRQGLVQVALALARVLDNPVAIGQHPSAAHRLSETLDKLRKGADSRKSRLATVRQLVKTEQAAG